MFQLFTTPVWFNRWDIIFDIVGLLVAFLIAAYSWRVYRINQENRFAYFSLAFMLVAAGFFFKMFTSSIVYFTSVRDVAADVLRPVAGKGLSFSLIYYRAAFFFQMVTTLGAWLLMFFISQKPRARLRKYYEVSQIALFVYLLLLISIISNFRYSAFYLTSTVLLSLTVLNYYKNYLNTGKNRKAFSVMVSFLFIMLGNISLVFVFMSDKLYVLGEVLVLIGFLILLITYRRITKR
jgi:hypothetical protein